MRFLTKQNYVVHIKEISRSNIEFLKRIEISYQLRALIVEIECLIVLRKCTVRKMDERTCGLVFLFFA